jgi:hypothetical protein
LRPVRVLDRSNQPTSLILMDITLDDAAMDLDVDEDEG